MSSDADLRRLERRYAGGELEAGADLLRRRLRRGEVTESELEEFVALRHPGYPWPTDPEASVRDARRLACSLTLLSGFAAGGALLPWPVAGIGLGLGLGLVLVLGFGSGSAFFAVFAWRVFRRGAVIRSRVRMA